MKPTPLNGPIALRIRDRLAAVICTRYGSLRAWAEHVKEPYQSVTGRFHHREFRLCFAEAVCRDLGVDLLRLAAPDLEPGAPVEGTVNVPLIRPVSCRDGKLLDERAGTRSLPAEFIPSGCVRPVLVTAMDAGMAPEILEGDLLLVDRDEGKRQRGKILPGVVYLVHTEGMIVPRKVYPTADTVRYIIRPTAPDAPPVAAIIPSRDVEREILGVVVGSWRGGVK